MAGAIPADGQPDDRNYSYLCQKYSNSLRNDERLKAMLLYRAELIQCLVPEELLDHMALLLSNEKIEQIKCTCKNYGLITASRQLLDALLECGEPNLYTTFVDILQRAGHEKALGLMKGIRRIQSEQVFEQVIKLMRDGIVNYLVVNVELLNELVAANCITEKAKDVIQSIANGNSRQAAASALLDHIKMFIREWPREFVRALKSTGNESVVELLFPDFLDPNKNIEEVLEDLVAANKAVIPEDPPHLGQDATDSSFSIPHDAVAAQIIKQTATNEGGGNFNLAVGGQAQVTINSTVNVMTPTSSFESDEASAPPANVVTNVRTEIIRVDSSDDVSANCLDAPQRIDNILGRRNITLTSNLDKNKNLSQNATKEKEKTELELYPFQKTLARPGIEGKNTIICAPTGSGKTIIAASIMKDHLKNNPGKHKVIFLACEVALANQQNRQFEKFLGPEFKSFVISGGAESGDSVLPIKMLLCDYDIIVLTAQILVNAMSPKAAKFDNEMDLVKFSDFSLMVFDECHHAGSDHPYNRIMSEYVDQKLSGNKELPQVIGLTATLGVGKGSSMSQAIEHVVTMCANLDATVLSNPDEAMMEQIHETAMRRARAENSTYEVVTGGALGSKKAQKEDLNKIRERMMVCAIEDVKKMRPDVYAGHIRSFQETSSKERKTAMARQRKKAQGNQMGPYYLLCRWCIAPLCTSVELRLLAGLHHTVISESFKDKYVKDLNAKPKIMDAFEFRGKIACRNCYKQLGVFALYRKVPFPLLKASSILIENAIRDENDEVVLDKKKKPKMNLEGYNQWQKVPFSVHEITDDELKTAMSAVDGTDDSHESSDSEEFIYGPYEP